MYESFYGLSGKPFQLRPDPHFFFASKGHKRAMAYLEYGLSQGEGFIVITGEIGAGKTTLMRNLFTKLGTEKIVAAQIVNTQVNSNDILRMVASAFGIACEGANETTLLIRLEQFLRQCDQQGKRALLVVDEAQNLTTRAVEELRMLSNFQSADRPLLQTFLLGQPEFRKVLLGVNMQQLLQRVIATYHLGPMDAEETRFYIEHRLRTVGWRNDPSFSEAAFAEIHRHTGGIPRKINTFCDRLCLMGYLEEMHAFTEAEVRQVIADIEQEFVLPVSDGEVQKLPEALPAEVQAKAKDLPSIGAENVDETLFKVERSITSALHAVEKMLSSFANKNRPEGKN